MYRPVRTVAPAAFPVTLAEAKQQVRADFDDDDSYLQALIAAATTHLDGWTGILGRCLEEQTWRQDFDGFWRVFRLPLAPVISITTLGYLDAAGASQTVDAANYVLLEDERGPFLRLNDGYAYPAVRAQGPAVSVTYKAGYAQANGVSTVPADLKHAIKLAVSHWYDHRDAVVVGASVAKLPLAFDALVAPHRRVQF